MRQIKIFDTTLRDGDQTPGVNISARQKLEIALQLEHAGIDIIEPGFAAASPSDFKAVSLAGAQVRNSVIASLARANENDIDAAREALAGAKRPRLHIFIAASPVHMKYKLNMTEDEVYAAAVEAVRYGRRFFEDVQFSAEDATRSDRNFLCRLFEGVIDAGAATVNIPDTVGYIQPREYAELIGFVRNNVKNIDRAAIAVHCHDDLGLAVANSLAAVGAGASQVDCTVNGIGERAGNAALEEVAMALTVRKDFYDIGLNIATSEISRISKTVSDMSGMHIPPNKAIVGKNIFIHESGIHQHGVLENPETYEIFPPETIGKTRNTMLLGKLSGRHAFAEKARELGFSLDREVLDKAFASFKQIAGTKKVVGDEEIAVIIRDFVDQSILDSGYRIDMFQTQSGSAMKATAMLSLTKDGVSKCDAAIGNGPIDAAFNAINKIVNKDISLFEYRIRAVTDGADALGEVNVKIKYEDNIYGGHGVSVDIIEASIKSYVNAINRALYYSENS